MFKVQHDSPGKTEIIALEIKVVYHTHTPVHGKSDSKKQKKDSCVFLFWFLFLFVLHLILLPWIKKGTNDLQAARRPFHIKLK